MEGDQYNLATFSDTTPWVIQMKTPHAKNVIETRVASVTASDYMGELLPIRVEDVEHVQLLNDLVKDEWARLDLNNMVDDAIRDSSFIREGYIHFMFNAEKTYGGTREGAAEAYPVDSPSVYLDPNARCWKDLQYVIVVGRISKNEAKYRYDTKVSEIKVNQSGVTEMERGEIGIANDYSTEQHDFYTIMTFYEKEKGKIRETVLVEDVVMSSDILDGLSVFPIAQMRWTKKKQTCYGISLMDDIITLQKAINMIESAVTNIAVSSASPAVIIQKGQGLNPRDVADTLGAPQVVYSVNGDPAKAMVPFNPQNINEAVVRIKQEHEQSLIKAAGVTDQYLGSLGTVGNTSGGAKMAIERAKVQEGAVIKNIQEFIEQITEILVQYIMAQYADTNIRTMKRQEVSRQFEVKEVAVPKDIGDTQYQFSIDLNIRTPFSKELEKQSLMELWQMERQYDSPVKILTVLDVLNKYDLSNMDELRSRYADATTEANGEKASVIMTLNELAIKYQLDQQLLQTAITEIMSGAKQTPAVEQLLAMVDQAEQQQQMAQQQAEAQQMQMTNEVARGAADQIVNQMDPNEVMNMAQTQSLPAQIEQLMGGGGAPTQ